MSNESTEILECATLSIVWAEAKRRLEVIHCSKGTIFSYKGEVNHLTQFMLENGVINYSPKVGELFLEERASIADNLSFCNAIVRQLNLALSNAFWAEPYQLKNYVIHNTQLQSLFTQLCHDLELFAIKDRTKRYILRCVYLVDIFMREHSITVYTPEVGQEFLHCMEQVSTISDERFTLSYVNTIHRLDSYFRDEKPYFITGKSYKIHNEELQRSLDLLLERLTQKQYASIQSYTKTICRLDIYMREKAISTYSPEVGAAFLKDCMSWDEFSENREPPAVAHIAHFNDAFTGNAFQRYHVKKQTTMPEEFKGYFSLYLGECEENNNSSRTIKLKTDACTKFFISLLQLGISDIRNVAPDAVVEVCAHLPSHLWCDIRGYLRCCFLHDLIPRDYSYLVPHKKVSILIPPYYTKEERQLLEKAPDRTTSIGKRDYAIILIANRLGLRSSDIVSLEFSEINSCKRTIDFEQYKTKIDHSLPLLPEIERAVKDYVDNGRPKSDSNKVFLMSYAPYDPLAPIAIHGIITKNFQLANVDISNRKHGAHSLRASLGTDLVNNGFSYNEAKDILGQQDPDVTAKHYATLDVGNLRLCALKPYPPTGNFKALLATERRLS